MHVHVTILSECQASRVMHIIDKGPECLNCTIFKCSVPYHEQCLTQCGIISNVGGRHPIGYDVAVLDGICVELDIFALLLTIHIHLLSQDFVDALESWL